MANTERLQPNYNIGLVGNVSNGKTTCVKALTGIETFKYSQEKERGITMKIGYANCKIFKCLICPEPECYHPTGSKISSHKCTICGSDTKLVQYFSFIDCPGHESLMNTMLSGATIMDYAILLIDGSQKCPQPQTIEHLAALEILRVEKIIIIQNKLDLIDGNKAQEQYEDIKKFIKGTCAESAPIIPLSAQKKYNIDILCEFIIKYFGEFERPPANPKMNVIRSFDVNRPGTDIQSIVGGVLGGSLISGQFKVGDIIEIRPGLVKKSNDQNLIWKPIRTEIISMKTDMDQINMAQPGGLIGLCTNLDPTLTRSDRMVGQVVGLPDFMPEVYLEINAKCVFMKKIGTTDIKVSKPIKNDNILLNISSKSVFATIKKVSKLSYSFELKYPCCMNIGEKFSISKKFGDSWRLIGMGELI
jgi:translation initiation factor 2 subunit 3